MSDAMIPTPVARRARRVLERVCDEELRLSTAESCTGGLVAALFTDIEGCSHAFERGLVVYSAEAKHEMLGVPAEVLDTCRAVSREAAVAMAEGALARSQADLAVSVTGFAGPAGDEGTEGHVHFALARSGVATEHREEAFGAIGRDAIRHRCLETVLEMLESSFP
ncbi:CinA family protein [Marinovum sp.]|uniref:CinA family protein n=1 Tax=Marinovum sp. TaxID=2024839 RepID=UPI003A904D0A